MPSRLHRGPREGEQRMDEARESADPLVSPRQIALTYDCVVSAHWRGETDTASALDAWFQAHWSDHAPPEPEARPGARDCAVAQSLLGHSRARGGAPAGHRQSLTSHRQEGAARVARPPRCERVARRRATSQRKQGTPRPGVGGYGYGRGGPRPRNYHGRESAWGRGRLVSNGILRGSRRPLLT